MTLKASFIGLGNMGAAMASDLLKHGVELAVYNRTKEKAIPLVKSGAKLLEHPSDAFNHAPIVFSMVSNDQALEDITEGPNGLLASARPGCIHVSSSTVVPATTHKLALKHQEKGVHFIAAPVFGRPEAAAKQELWIAAAGDPTARKQVLPLLNMMGKKVYEFGDKPEVANIVKLANNFLLVSTIEMLSEAFAFAQKSGVNPEQLYDFLTETSFSAPVFITYGKLIIHPKSGPAGFKLALGEKDLHLFLDAAASVHANTPLAQVVEKQLLASIDKGREEMDLSALSLLEQESS